MKTKGIKSDRIEMKVYKIDIFKWALYKMVISLCLIILWDRHVSLGNASSVWY